MSVLGPSRFLHGKRILFFLVSDSQAGQGKPSWCRKLFKKRNVHTCKINRNAVSLCYILCCAPAGASQREWAAGDLLVASGFDWAARHRKSQQKKARRPNRSRRPRRMKRKPKPVQLRNKAFAILTIQSFLLWFASVYSTNNSAQEFTSARSTITAPLRMVHVFSNPLWITHSESSTSPSTCCGGQARESVEGSDAKCRQLLLRGTAWWRIIRGPRRERCLFKEWWESCQIMKMDLWQYILLSKQKLPTHFRCQCNLLGFQLAIAVEITFPWKQTRRQPSKQPWKRIAMSSLRPRLRQRKQCGGC